MKRQLILSLAMILLLAGCKKEVRPTETPITKEAQPEEAIAHECYVYEKNGDTIQLQLQRNKDVVMGGLVYALAEKDRNVGLFKGKMENDILLADYTFNSEGTKSTRQIIFQLKDGKLIEGYGEMDGGGTRFKDVKKVTFTSNMPLSKVDCN